MKQPTETPASRGRRQFLLASSAAAIAAVGPPALSAEPAIRLRRGEHDLFRVRMELSAEGNVNVADNPLVARRQSAKLPMKSKAVFDYEERFVRPEDADEQSIVTMMERYYHECHSNNQLNRNEQTIRLRPSVRETVVRRDTLPEVIYPVDDYFEGAELELLRLPVCSAAVDEMLPIGEVATGSKYAPSKDAIASLLNLSSVEAGDIRAEVVAINEADARIHFQGKVDGSVDGVPTLVRTVGKLTFDRKLGTCTWLAMAVHETREIGIAEPGFDLAATIKMIRKPLETTMALLPQPRPHDVTGPIPTDRLYLELTSEHLGFRAIMGRNWRWMNDASGAAMMRMIENDRSIAQCDFRTLPSLEEGERWTLDRLRSDVQQRLGEQLTELIEAEQSVNQAGLEVLRISAQGTVEGVPIRWVILHFSDDSGRRISATFTMEEDSVEAFAGADLQLAGTLRLEELAPSGSKQTANNRWHRAPSARVAETKLGEDSDSEVQSPSNLR